MLTNLVHPEPIKFIPLLQIQINSQWWDSHLPSSLSLFVPSPMREDLIKSAESFLSSANVQSADKDKKVQFLKKKGLNDEEIEEAFKRVGGDSTTPTTPTTVCFRIGIVSKLNN